MAIMVKKSEGKSFDPLAEGAYPARVYQVIHVGTYPGYQGKMQNKVLISFEFPTELNVFKEESGEQPYVLSQEYTLSFHEKSQLKKVIDACDPKALKLDGEGFVEEYDIESLLGKTCLVTVIHKDSKSGDTVYANIGNCTLMPKGMTCPDPINPPKVLNYTEFDKFLFLAQPQFIQDKIKSSLEYKELFEDKDAEAF